MVARNRARRSSPLYLPSAFDLFKPSKDLFMEHLNVFALLYIIPLFFWLHGWISTPAHGGHYWSRTTDANYGWTVPAGINAAFIGFTVFWFVIAIALAVITAIMQQRAQLDVSEDKVPTIQHCWNTVKQRWWDLFKLYIAMVVIIGVGLILLIIPGLIMVRRYMFAPYVMLEKNCGVKEALEESHRIGLVNTGAVWGIIGVTCLISLLGVVPIIGSLVSFIGGALYSIAPALRYQQLKKIA